MKEEELLKKLRDAFKSEAEERLKVISSSLVELEEASGPDKQRPIVEVIFREAHSLKGAARAVNLVDIENLCQSMEGVFSALKREEIPLFPELFDKLHYTVSSIETILMDSGKDDALSLQEEVPMLIRQLEELICGGGEDVIQEDGAGIAQGGGESGVKESKGPALTKPVEQGKTINQTQSAPSKPPASGAVSVMEKEAPPSSTVSVKHEDVVPSPAKAVECEKAHKEVQAGQNRPLISGTVRISTEKLDSLMLKAEELILLKLAEGQHLANLQDTMQSFEFWKKKWSKIESELRSIGKEGQKGHEYNGKGHSQSSEADFLGLFDWNQEQVQSLGQRLKTLVKTSEQNHHSLGRMVDDILDDMKNVTMLPFSTLFDILPRTVRDIARNQGKEAELKLQGGDIEIDRRILEEMKDPIIHLLRNAIDHGLEDPEKREAQEKPRQGTISLTVSQTEGNKVEILFSDDGKGIDFSQVKEEAISKGLISRKEAQNLKDQDAMSLIFRSGVSTSPMITQISGRGLGLAIVQEKVEQLGGVLSLETEPGKGSTFKILIPVTMATFKGILVQMGDDLFIVPTAHVERVLRVQRDTVQTVEGNATIPLDGRALSLVELGDVLEITKTNNSAAGEQDEYMTLLILGVDERQMAFKVDEVLTEQEVLVKGMGKQLNRVRNIAGATVLGSGEVVPILNVQDMLKSAVKGNISSIGVNVMGDGEETQMKSVLVVEDSITSRMLIKNILESAGYLVKTASDGMEGYSVLKSECFDLVVSDVEMPRMNGFELTQKIRSDKTLAETPVVLCTSLESREDRERGVEVGANAYIVKSGFDQSNLLDVVKRFS